MKIGVMVESFRIGFDGGLESAAQLGADGIQLYTVKGETHFEGLLGKAAGRDLKRKVADLGLEISALCGDFGKGFGDAGQNARLVEDSNRVMDLALELGCRVVTTHIGVVPNFGGEINKQHPQYSVMADACGELGAYGAKVGAVFAVETGPEPSAVLKAFIEDIAHGGGLGVNFDPANLTMVIAEDIPSAVKTLGPFIVHTHAKDGIHLKDFDAREFYEGHLPADDYIREVPLGEGEVPWKQYLQALRDVGFDGYLTIEREVGDNPRADIELAVAFLKKQLGR